MPTMAPGMGGTAPVNNPMNLVQKMIFNKMYQANPVIRNSDGTTTSFRDLLDQSQGMSPEQAFQQRGLDFNQFQNIDPMQIKSMMGF